MDNGNGTLLQNLYFFLPLENAKKKKNENEICKGMSKNFFSLFFSHLISTTAHTKVVKKNTIRIKHTLPSNENDWNDKDDVSVWMVVDAL